MSGMVEIERKGPVAHLWLNRPEQHNALSPELGAELAQACHTLAHDDGVRVIVLRGRGKSFCAGADIGAMKASANVSFDDNLADATKLAGMFTALADLPKPIVGRIHGSVYGGGVALACACDIPVASSDAMFGLTEVRLGIIPAIVSPYVIRRLGDRVARELMLTGERFDAARAQVLGVVNYVVTPDELDAKVADRVQALLHGGPQAQRRIKMLLELWADSTWEEYRSGLPRTLAEIRSGAEAKDGLSAFFEKRRPGWSVEK
jgi:methylglutaconyl-CoA hydratase